MIHERLQKEGWEKGVIHRLAIDLKNAAIASRIIKEDDPENKSRKHRSYVPFWA